MLLASIMNKSVVIKPKMCTFITVDFKLFLYFPKSIFYESCLKSVQGNISPGLHYAFEVMPANEWMPLGYGYDITSGFHIILPV